MNAHISTQLKASELTKRNNGLALGNACKVCGNTHIFRLVSPVNHVLRRLAKGYPANKLMSRLWLYAFRLSQHPALPTPL